MTTNTDTTAASGAAQPDLQTVVKYLCGEGPLCGVWFGDGVPAGDEGSFWWRRYLRAALAAPAAQEAEPIPSEPTDEMYTAAQEFRLPTGDEDGGSIVLNTSEVRAIWQAMRAALYAHPPRPQADAVGLLRKMREWYGVHATLHYSPLLAQVDDLLAAAPQAPAARAAPTERRSDLVPGVMHCAKCKFQLNRVTLCVSDGNTYAGDSKTEPCPNGCGPLWPVTWEQEARSGWKALEEMHDRLQNATRAAAPAQEAAPLTQAELEEVKRAADDIEDCGETDVDYDLLLRAAMAGYLECARFRVLDQSALDRAAARARQEGGA